MLRKHPIDNYILFAMWYHISECDEDYTNEYLEEEEQMDPSSLLKEDTIGDDPEEKAKNVTFFDLYHTLFKSRVIFKFIQFHRGFDFLINELGYVISSHQTDIIEKERSQLLNFRNVLHLIEHTLKNEKFTFPDF